MLLKSGRHPGKTTEYVILVCANDASYIIDQHPDGVIGKEYRRLRKIFDAKPFVSDCYRCGETATRVSAYRGSPRLMLWCNECDPYSQGASAGKLDIFTSFDSAIAHVDYTCNGVRAFKNMIVKDLAEAKGCPKRVTRKAALEFFNG